METVGDIVVGSVTAGASMARISTAATRPPAQFVPEFTPETPPPPPPLVPPDPIPAVAVENAAAAESASAKTVSVLDPTGCFVAGTLVHVRDGLRPIEEIRIGDYVLSQPEDTGERSYRKVIETFVYDDKSILEVSYADASGRTESVLATYRHPFWVKGVGWQGAQYLDVGQTIELHDGRETYITALVETGLNDRVHNFTVDGFHTFYVGQMGAWVHNEGVCGAGGLEDLPEMAPTKIGALFDGYHPDTMIHITSAEPESFANGIDPNTYFSKLGDVVDLTPRQFREDLVGRLAGGYSPSAKLFVAVGPEHLTSFRALPPDALNLTGTTEYLSTVRLMPHSYVRVP